MGILGKNQRDKLYNYGSRSRPYCMVTLGKQFASDTPKESERQGMILQVHCTEGLQRPRAAMARSFRSLSSVDF